AEEAAGPLRQHEQAPLGRPGVGRRRAGQHDPAALMSSALDCGNELALAALVEMTAAAAVIPAAWPCVELLVINQSDPGAIYATGEAWLKLGGELGKIATAYDNTAGKLPRPSWDATDRDAFDQKIGDEQTQLQLTRMLATVV